MRVSQQQLDELIAHARDELPNECCGMIASQGGEAVKIFRAANAEASPLRYGIDPKDQLQIIAEIEENGWELGAIYHSHTKSAAYPSQTDVNLAFYPDALYVIVSLAERDNPSVRAFRIIDGQIEEESLEVG